MPTPRYSLAAGVINGRLYAVGGCCDSSGHDLNALDAYKSSKNIWTAKASMPTAREGLAAGVINKILYAVCGDSDNGALNTNEAFNLASHRRRPTISPAFALLTCSVRGEV